MFQEMRQAFGRGPHLYLSCARATSLVLRGPSVAGGSVPERNSDLVRVCLRACSREDTRVDRLEIETNCDAGLGKKQRSDRRTF